MPVLLLLTSSDSLCTDVTEALEGVPASEGMVIPCSSVEQASEVTASLSESVIWLVDAAIPGQEGLPKDLPVVYLLTDPEADLPPGRPCLELPLRSRELRALLSHLIHTRNASTRPRYSQEQMEVFVHDLNNRLTTLSGYLSLLPELVQGEDDMFAEMETALRDAEAMIDGLIKDR